MGSHFVITIPPATKVHCLKWLEKIGTVESEGLVDSKQVITILSLKPRRQDGLQRSLRTLFQKRGLPINNVFLISKRTPRTTHDAETQAGGPEDEAETEEAEETDEAEETGEANEVETDEEVIENEQETAVEASEEVPHTSMDVAENEVMRHTSMDVAENEVVGRTSLVASGNINITNLLDCFMIGGKAVRKTQDVPPKVSVYDLIDVIMEIPNSGRKTFFRLKNENPEVGALCPNLKFEGPGQRNTPVTDARGAVTIINLLPGRNAATFRAASADVFVRFMGGDPSLIDEIQRNAEAQQALPATSPARLFGEDVQARDQARRRPTGTYTASSSTLAIEPGPLPGFDGPGVYFIEYGDRLLYNLEHVPEGAKVIGFGHAKVIGFGHAKVSGATRCNKHRQKTGVTTRVLDFIPTLFYELVERRLEKRLKALRKIVMGNIVGTSVEMHEQFWVMSAEEYARVLRESQADAEEFKTTMGAETPLLIERERTKQAEAATLQAEAARLPLEVLMAMEQTKRLESEARIAEATASIRVKELELEILRLQLRVQ